MLIAVFGPPCPMTKWGVHLVRTIADVALDGYDFIDTSSLDQLRAEWEKRTHKHLVYFADCPEAAIVDMFVRSHSPIAVFTDEPNDIVAWTIQGKTSVGDAVRATSKWFSALHDLFIKPGVVIFSRPKRATSLRKGVELLAKLYAIPIDERKIDTIMSRLVKPHRSGDDADIQLAITQYVPDRAIGEWRKKIDLSDQALLAAVTSPLEGVVAGHSLSAVTWPKAMMRNSDKKGIPLATDLDLIGSPRQLTFGPYLNLPRGEWTAIFFLKVEESRSSNSLRADILSDRREILGLGHFDIAEDGTFTVELKFEVTEPCHMLEARLALVRGAIEGRLDLLKVDMRRNEPEPASAAGRS